MKKKIVFCVMSLVCALSFLSCSQDDEKIYSCDKEINEWVNSNIDQVHLMTRSQWQGLSNKVGIAVYRAFTPKQKITFWQEKFRELKTLDWSKDELLHINKAEDFMNANVDLFDSDKRTEKDIDELNLFFYKWQKEAEEKLGWDKAIVYSIAGTGAAVKDKKGSIEIRKKSLKSIAKMSVLAESGNGNDPECNCNKESSISCFPAGPPCDKAKCDKTEYGCSWMWVSPCDGRCGGL